MSERAVFLDKDGTLIEDVPYNVDPERIRLVAGAERALAALHRAGYRLFVVTNQAGVAHGYFAEAALLAVEARLRELLAEMGVPLAGFYYCPHSPEARVASLARDCDCRKPAPGLLLRAARDHGIDLPSSWMIGDILSDVEAGNRAGCRTALVDDGSEHDWARLSPLSTPHIFAPDLPTAAELLLAETNVRPGGSPSSVLEKA